MILDILTHPNPNLRKKSHKVSDEEILSSDFNKLVKDMSETMFKKDGVGLAAPQVSKNLRVVIVNLKNSAITFINPKILKKSWRKDIMEEGCLSVPGIYGKVKRPINITLKFQDGQGKKQKIKANKLLARILQHEIDHLDGVLFIDKVVN